jgi:hypothetical protein
MAIDTLLAARRCCPELTRRKFIRKIASARVFLTHTLQNRLRCFSDKFLSSVWGKGVVVIHEIERGKTGEGNRNASCSRVLWTRDVLFRSGVLPVRLEEHPSGAPHERTRGVRRTVPSLDFPVRSR